MAYCLRSFVETLAQVLYPHQHYKKWVLNQNHIPQIQSLFDNATFLQDFLDKSSPLIQETISSLEDQIMEAAEKAADTLESYITDQLLLNPEDQSFTIFPPDMGEALHAFEVAKEEVIKIECASQPSYYNNVSPYVSRTRYPDSENMVVGIEEDLNKLRSRLTSARVTGLDVIPIIGMGGIGKTTLARILYDEFSSISHFDRCAWVTVSQSYDPQRILRTILACVIGKPLNEMPQQETGELITSLYQALVGRRYLIVLDDIWSYKAWDDVQMAFAREYQGSRIIFTTRENSLVDYVKSNSHEMHLINEDKSWELLRRKVFGDESCPPELEKVGKRIAKNCGGLPLALQVIGGQLAHSQRSEDFWDYVAHNVSSLIAKTDNQFSGIFTWSFSHLPHYLKPCFLHMGAFPEDCNIFASKLIKLWVAEGFLYPVPNKSLEEAAEIHLNALVDRNLIFVRIRKSNGKAKSYGIHDLLRDLCLRKAQEKKFLYVKDSKTDILQEDILCFRRVSVHLPNNIAEYDYGSLKLTSLTRSFILIGYKKSDGFASCLCYKSLLRVLDVCLSATCDFQEVFLHLINLRYLNIGNYPLSIDISLLKNLQTLRVARLKSFAILEHLPQLRNLQFRELEGRYSTYSLQIYPHENLQHLSLVPLGNLYYLLEKIPNLRKLGIGTDDSLYERGVDLTCFQKLESLELSSTYSSLYTLRSNIIFPRSLKKLTFRGLKIIDAIGVFPGLQVLKLMSCKFENSTWEPSEGEFCQLQYLEIDGSNLENWLATEIHFPVLQHLVIQYCDDLVEIPNDFGGIETLETINLDKCKASVFDSARTILKEQLEFGNSILQLQLGRTLDDIENEEAARRLEFFESEVLNHGLTICNRTFSTKTIFPYSLKKLTLEGCYFRQTILSAMGVLPQLEVLKLKRCYFWDSTWEPFEGEFCQLQHLEISNFKKLVKWFATEIHFPLLRHLVIIKCRDLSEIPMGFGRIETLEIIEVDECKPSVVDSARIILEEQREFGNTILQLRLGRTIKDIEKEKIARPLKFFESEVQNHGLTIRNMYSLSTKTIFPHSLKKLKLSGCEIASQTILSAMGVLPELQFLKLKYCMFKMSSWEPSDGEFCQLQYLEITSCNLEKWLATEIHFPVLRHLVLRHCGFLIDIPIGIGRIQTLEIIEVEICKPSLVDSARMILEEQRELGNTRLQLQLDCELVEEVEE